MLKKISLFWWFGIGCESLKVLKAELEAWEWVKSQNSWDWIKRKEVKKEGKFYYTVF